jgi:hypothetical protein
MRSLISSVHFSGISSPQKEAGATVVGLRRPEARDIPAVANPGLTARGGDTVRHGMSGGFICDEAARVMQMNERLAISPPHIVVDAFGCRGHPCLRLADDFANLRLRKSGRLNFEN